MPQLAVTLFGSLSVRSEDEPVPGFDAGKVQELFAYVLIHRDRPHLREALAGVLWGDSSTAQSKKYLRQTLWLLQHALEPFDGAASQPTLTIQPEWVRLNPASDLWLDVAAFEEALVVARGVQSHELSDDQVTRLERAVELYRGELLEGFYQEWCLFERERLQSAYLTMLDKLMGACQVRQRYEAGLAYGDRILRYDRAREQTHRRLMVLAYLAGDRTTALRQFDRCGAALEEELGVKPSMRTVSLYEQIRADRLDGLVPPTGAWREMPARPAAQDLLASMRSVWSALASAERELEDQIRALERVANSRR